MGDPNYALFRGVEITTLIVALLFTIVRLINRVYRKTLSLDDAILVVGVTLAVAITIMILHMLDFGYGKNEAELEPAWGVPLGKLSLASFTLFPVCYCLIRSSIVLTYLRLFPAQTNRWFCYGLFALQGVYALWASLMTLLQCNPVAGYWRHDVTEKCIDPKNQDFAILTLNSTFDIVVYLWPAHYLYNLNLPMRQRVGLIAMFSVGIVNIGLSFTRLSLLIVMYSTKDYSRYGVWGCMIIVLEAHIGITTACLPYVRYMYDFVAAKISSISQGSRSRGNSRTGHNGCEDGSHAFQHLSDEHKRICVERKPDIVFSSFNGEEEEEAPRPGYRRNSLYRTEEERRAIEEDNVHEPLGTNATAKAS